MYVWFPPMIGVDAVGTMEAVGMIDPDDYTSPEIYCHGRLQQRNFHFFKFSELNI